MTPRLRKFALTAHVTFSVGWLGAVVTYFAIAIAGLKRSDAQVVESAFIAMDLTGWFVIVPLSIASLLSGLVQSLGTDWGLIRYYWVLVKFTLTIGATTILLLHMPSVGRKAGAAAEVIHAGGGLLVLVTATTLSIYKPWGRTPYGRREKRDRQRILVSDPAAMSSLPPNADRRPDLQLDEAADDARLGSTTGSRLGMAVLLGTAGLLVLLIVLHLTGGSHVGH
jgi:hypothetical protein